MNMAIKVWSTSEFDESEVTLLLSDFTNFTCKVQSSFSLFIYPGRDMPEATIRQMVEKLQKAKIHHGNVVLAARIVKDSHHPSSHSSFDNSTLSTSVPSTNPEAHLTNSTTDVKQQQKNDGFTTDFVKRLANLENTVQQQKKEIDSLKHQVEDLSQLIQKQANDSKTIGQSKVEAPRNCPCCKIAFRKCGKSNFTSCRTCSTAFCATCGKVMNRGFWEDHGNCTQFLLPSGV